MNNPTINKITKKEAIEKVEKILSLPDCFRKVDNDDLEMLLDKYNSENGKYKHIIV